jgi:hypothetical protein
MRSIDDLELCMESLGACLTQCKIGPSLSNGGITMRCWSNASHDAKASFDQLRSVNN